MATSFDIIKVRLDSPEELSEFEKKCFSDQDGIQFGAQRPRKFPCELDIKKRTITRLLPPDYFEVAERIISYWVFNVTYL